ncbi:MAG: GNAT family N-acetyltransferase [Clostridia bacterium]|nr:GNAT family N-acetyltransferase [Clostridia bacterium]
MEVELIRGKRGHYKYARELYESSFPDLERKPWLTMLGFMRNGNAELNMITYDKKICGFVYILSRNNTALVDYLAIDNEMRGKGVGSAVCKLLGEKYFGQKLFLEVEKPDVIYPNYQERLRRQSFYLKNGLIPTGIFIRAYGTELELMTFGMSITYPEYIDFMKEIYAYRFDALNIQRA